MRLVVLVLVTIFSSNGPFKLVTLILGVRPDVEGIPVRLRSLIDGSSSTIS